MKETIKQIQRINPTVIEQMKQLIGTSFVSVTSNRARLVHGFYLRATCGEEGYINFWDSKNATSFYLWFKSGTRGLVDDQTGLRTVFPMKLKKYKKSKVHNWYNKETREIDYSKAPFPDLSQFNFNMSIHKNERGGEINQKVIKEINLYHHIAEYYSEDLPNWDIDLLSLMVFKTETGREFLIEMNSSIPEFDFYIDEKERLEIMLKLKVEGVGPTAGKPFHQLVHVIK
ncbi:MAG: hypothetical protein AAFZ15_08475 [Bacteroidota bacterium]